MRRSHLFVAAIAFAGCARLAGPEHPNVSVVVDANGAVIENGTIGLAAAARAFYANHADSYDFLVLFTATRATPDVGTAGDLAEYETVRNDVSGIDVPPTFDDGSEFGSTSRLQGVIYLGSIGTYYDPAIGAISDSLWFILAHETGHRWAAYVRCDSDGTASNYLLDFRHDHWTLAMDSGGSPMGGYGWRDNGDGTFTDVARWTGDYSMLDLYLMGLAAPDEVGPIHVLDISPRPYSIPLDTTIATDIVTKSVQDIISVEGARSPAYGASPNSWRTAFALVVTSNGDATADVVEGVDAARAGWPQHFHDLTHGRGTMVTTLSE